MNQARQRKLIIILFMVSIVALVIALVLYALRQNISLFYTPSQIATGRAPKHQAIRIGGMVVPGSIRRGREGLSVQFKITDYEHTVAVVYEGILPDLFREGQGIVAQGELLDNQQVKATQVLAKHDEKYMPPEVKDALDKARKK